MNKYLVSYQWRLGNYTRVSNLIVEWNGITLNNITEFEHDHDTIIAITKLDDKIGDINIKN